jgi:hypothetical protein
MLGGNPRERIQAYRKFIAREDNGKLAQLLSRKRWPVFLGSEKFMATVKGKFFSTKADSEMPQRKELAPEVDRVFKVVSKDFGVRERDIFSSRRGKENEARNVAIYLVRRLRGDRLKEIGTAFRIDRYSTVSSIVERMKARIGRDESLRKKINGLILLIMSQEQT